MYIHLMKASKKGVLAVFMSGWNNQIVSMGRKEQERRKRKQAAASLSQNIEHMFKKTAKQGKVVIFTT